MTEHTERPLLFLDVDGPLLPFGEGLEIRIYVQGWSIRQVAARFDCSYGTIRRILKRQTPWNPERPRSLRHLMISRDEVIHD